MRHKSALDVQWEIVSVQFFVTCYNGTASIYTRAMKPLQKDYNLVVLVSGISDMPAACIFNFLQGYGFMEAMKS